ncbi:MAG: hypothetical protein JW836_05495 [Deltaproteobacteria bacterium]|nr:hypothetical protein [Deltaproteobacteria bacterium]
MRKSATLKYQGFREALAHLAQVLRIDEHKQHRIERTLSGLVQVSPRANVTVKDLFCPKWAALILLKRSDGTYIDLCNSPSRRYRY